MTVESATEFLFFGSCEDCSAFCMAANTSSGIFAPQDGQKAAPVISIFLPQLPQNIDIFHPSTIFLISDYIHFSLPQQ